MEPNMETTQRLTRRQLVGAGAGIAGAGIALGIGNGPARALAASGCANLTPVKTIGPYFVEESLNRTDITTDPSTGAVVAGIPLVLDLTLIDDDNGCVPLAGAQVDIWHASPAGLYSDEAAEGTSGKKYLRGYQVSDALGNVSFKTVYPGWYSGRTVHIHIRIRLFTGTTATYDFLTQLFFDDALTDAVDSMSPYNARGTRDTRNAADSIYGSDGATVQLAPTSDGAGGYVAPITFALDIRLLRGSKSLLHRKRAALVAGTHTLKIALPRTLAAGRTTLRVTATDLTANRRTLTKIVHVPTA
jgi:protocatechuate 3,4-dioxygenase beta subunit